MTSEGMSATAWYMMRKDSMLSEYHQQAARNRGLANQYLSEFEVAAMANLVPESPEEAKLLIPSLEASRKTPCHGLSSLVLLMAPLAC